MHELLSFNFQPVAVQTNQKHLRVVLGYCSLKCPGMLLYGVVALQDVSIPYWTVVDAIGLVLWQVLWHLV